MAKHDLEMRPEPMTDANMVLAYMFTRSESGSTITFKSTKSENRYTFLIQESKLSEADIAEGKVGPFFIKTLIGRDNEADFAYMGMVSLWNGKWSFRLTAASARAHLTENDPRVKSFRWAFDPRSMPRVNPAFDNPPGLVDGMMPYGVLIFPSVRCTKCNRKLTNPDQPGYAQGFGPDCFEQIGGMDGVAAFSSKFRVADEPVVNSTFVFGSNTVRKPEPVKPFSVPPTTTPAYIKPVTPRAIVAAVNEDAEIAKLAAEMLDKNPANPKNIAPKPVVEPLPVDVKVAEALAKSQDGWTIEDAVAALAKRRVVKVKASTKVAEKAAVLVAEPQTDGVAETWKQIHQDISNWPNAVEQNANEAKDDLDSIEGF